MKLRFVLLILLAILASACGATTSQIIPTARPSTTPTRTATPTETPNREATLTPTPSPVPVSPTGGPSPTPLLGPTRTSAPDEPTVTRVFNPNAPRIEFFEANALAVAPGDTITLFWSVRGVDTVAIYRLNADGSREAVWNVDPAGNLQVRTRSRDRGAVNFVLSAGDGTLHTEQTLSIPLQCPIAWFFSPPPDPCPDNEAQPATLIEQPFERGRMVFVQEQNKVYALFNDGRTPAWVAFENHYDPAVYPERDPNFPDQPGLFQPVRELGLLWRANDTVRNRLGLGIEQEANYTGFFQTTTTTGGSQVLYISSSDGSALELDPGGNLWQIVTPR